MANAKTFSDSKTKNRSICSNCANTDICAFKKINHKNIWECELFATEGKKTNQPFPISNK